MHKKMLLTFALALSFLATSLAAQQAAIKLPPPDMKGGKPLMQCLKDRKTDRLFSTKKLPLDVMSNLLWAAAGINRPESGKRTAATARNWQEIDIYVALEEGLFLYNAGKHELEPVLSKDLRKYTTTFLQPERLSVAGAPVQLIYVADFAKMSFGADQEDKILYSAADTGIIVQNVYLYCASEGLAAGVRGMLDRDDLSKSMKLREQQRIILVQAVGYPRQDSR